MSDDNLKIWDVLGKTDPAETKKFKRSGGFAGTAIKPIYTTKKMTEQFGPAGRGWGMGEPTFQVVNGDNKEILVYCTVELWWQETDLQKTIARNSVYGVGGDKVITHIKANEQYKRPERWENDDEAFKKAFTDAIGNAMKHLGMSADVHMGLFDDSKYVNAVREELASNAEAPAFVEPSSKAKSRGDFDVIMSALRKAGNGGKAELRTFWTSANFDEAYEMLPLDWQTELVAERDAFIASYEKPATRMDPNTSLDRQFAATVGDPIDDLVARQGK